MTIKQNKGSEGELKYRQVSGAYGTVDSEDDSPRLWRQSVPDPLGYIPQARDIKRFEKAPEEE
jgi:hypothetical protein